MRLEDHIQDIPDFPKPGIVFKDITPLFLDADALSYTVDRLADYAREWEVDYVVSAEARGFVLGDALEMHSDAIEGGARVMVHDDLLATGGTAGALCGLVEQAGGVVAGCAFVIELAFLNGRERLQGYDVRSLVVVDDE